MPHLMTPGESLSVLDSGAGQPVLGVPGWAHPVLAPVEWAELARPGLPLHWAVLDIASGPGSRPDTYCLAAAAGLHEAGTGILGCLDMRSGARPFGELVSDAHRHLDWYGVDGFYLEHCPCGPGHLPEVRRTATTLRALCDGGHVVTGHGSPPHPGYAEVADQLVTFRGSWTEYRWSQTAQWTADHPPGRFCHLVHSVPRTHLDEALRIARWQGAGTVYFTDRSDRWGRNPWQSLPGYWDDIVSRIGPGVSE